MDQMTEEDRRIYLRDRVKDHNRQLQGAAKTKGVERYGVFIGAGYRGMYEAQLDQIKRKKKIADSEQLLDCIGDTELAANDFRATQTAEKLRNDPNIRGERMAIDTHEQVGRKVRQTMIEISSVKPEDLPRAKNLKLVERERKRKLREGKAKKLKE
jgi:DNA-damage-inducible protein D